MGPPTKSVLPLTPDASPESLSNTRVSMTRTLNPVDTVEPITPPQSFGSVGLVDLPVQTTGLVTPLTPMMTPLTQTVSPLTQTVSPLIDDELDLSVEGLETVQTSDEHIEDEIDYMLHEPVHEDNTQLYPYELTDVSTRGCQIISAFEKVHFDEFNGLFVFDAPGIGFRRDYLLTIRENELRRRVCVSIGKLGELFVVMKYARERTPFTTVTYRMYPNGDTMFFITDNSDNADTYESFKIMFDASSFDKYLCVPGISLNAAKDFSAMSLTKMVEIAGVMFFTSRDLSERELRDAYYARKYKFSYPRLDPCTAKFATCLLREATGFRYGICFHDLDLCISETSYEDARYLAEKFNLIVNDVTARRITLTTQMPNMHAAATACTKYGLKAFQVRGVWHIAAPGGLQVMVLPDEYQYVTEMENAYMAVLSADPEERRRALEYYSMFGYDTEETADLFDISLIVRDGLDSDGEQTTEYWVKSTTGMRVNVIDVAGPEDPETTSAIDLRLGEGKYMTAFARNVFIAHDGYILSCPMVQG